MIRRLTLKNWRSYEDATVRFSPGTTFVVASNGVGKTSLVEAARWALFARITDEHAAIRAGTTIAAASVELELPDRRILEIERTLTVKSRRIPPVVRLDGESQTEEELHQHLIDAYRTEPTFLAGLTMPSSDREKDKPSALGLEEHLGRYYGIDGLKTAVDQLKAMQKANEARIKRIKNANAATAKRLEQLRAVVDETARRVAAANEAYKTLQSRVDSARERERFELETRTWQDRVAERNEAVRHLAAQISVDPGVTISAGNIDDVLDHHLDEVEARLGTTRVDIAVKKSKAALLAANEERLAEAHNDCPVCRRPLDDTTIASAHETNAREIAAIRESIQDLENTENELLAQRRQLKAGQSEWRRVPKPGEPAQAPAAHINEPMSTAQLSPLVEDAIESRVAARTDHLQATQALDQAQNADEAMRELESLFKREASLTVAIRATEATLTQLLNDTIRPLASEVDQRWTALFPDRGHLSTEASGDITRNINGHPLPYDSFSTGESMGATILLRLLVAQMATAADFCWFDEPLEHLDPDVRRRLANLLSRATSGEGQLRQIVVTTYEEPLARQLQARDSDHVTLIDVRPAS